MYYLHVYFVHTSKYTPVYMYVSLSHEDDEETAHCLDVVRQGVEPEHLVERGRHLGGAQEPDAVLHQQLHRADVPAEHLILPVRFVSFRIVGFWFGVSLYRATHPASAQCTTRTHAQSGWVGLPLRKEPLSKGLPPET